MKRRALTPVGAFLGVMMLGGLTAHTYFFGDSMVNAAQSPASDAGSVTVPAAKDPGAQSYANHCAMCHGKDRQGNPPIFPRLVGIKQQMTDAQIIALIHSGRKQMPPFPNLQGEELTALVHFLGTPVAATQEEVHASNVSPSTVHPSSGGEENVHASGLAAAGSNLFTQNCSFCHGRDAMGGETGPDLTQSKLVMADVNGDKIDEVVRNGRPEKKMPAFNFSDQELKEIVAYIHSQQAKAASMKGHRRGVSVEDLQTGNVEAGKQYFNGAGTCSKCHSPIGDLAGIASKYEGLQLEEQMLYPKDAKSRVTVTLASGQQMTGQLEYQDEFTIGLRDSEGVYHSWPVTSVKYKVEAPVEAHVELFSRYTDADIHNLMAYIQTLK